MQSRTVETTLLTLLTSNHPGDRAMLEKRLTELPPGEATEALYNIAYSARYMSPRFFLRALIAIGYFCIYLPICFFLWIHGDLSSSFLPSMLFPLLFAIPSLERLGRYLRYRRARSAVFHLARFNDVRAVGELLHYRRRRPAQSDAIIMNDRVERELTRLLDELTGNAYIPGETRFQQILRKECFYPLRTREDIGLTRACFYIAIMRYLSEQSGWKNRSIIEQIGQIHPKTPNWTLVRDAALILVQPENAAQVPVTPRPPAASLAPTLQTLRRQ